MLATEPQFSGDRSGGPPDNINRGTMLLGKNLRQMTISQTDFSKRKTSVITWLAVLQIVTIFCLSYFLLMCYFVCQFISLLIMHMGILQKLFNSKAILVEEKYWYYST